MFLLNLGLCHCTNARNISVMTSWSFAACWKEDTHERPTFPCILQTLDDIARSKFITQMDDDNFYDLQDDWKQEIDETLHEIREREKVGYLGLGWHDLPADP